jgi:hypothetical protein
MLQNAMNTIVFDLSHHINRHKPHVRHLLASHIHQQHAKHGTGTTCARIGTYSAADCLGATRDVMTASHRKGPAHIYDTLRRLLLDDVGRTGVRTWHHNAADNVLRSRERTT